MIKKYINNLLAWGWTQTELARLLKTTQATISRWSTGTGTDYETFQKVEELWKKEKKKSDKRKAR